MVNKELIHRKLNKLIQYLNELEGIQEYTLEDYLDNYFIRRTTERLLQLIVEVATDINGHIIVENEEKPPTDYYESFIILSKLDIINKDFAQKLAPSTGLRNRLVHEYEEIDDKIVFVSIEKTLKMYRKYIEQINDYLN